MSVHRGIGQATDQRGRGVFQSGQRYSQVQQGAGSGETGSRWSCRRSRGWNWRRHRWRSGGRRPVTAGRWATQGRMLFWLQGHVKSLRAPNARTHATHASLVFPFFTHLHLVMREAAAMLFESTQLLFCSASSLRERVCCECVQWFCRKEGLAACESSDGHLRSNALYELFVMAKPACMSLPRSIAFAPLQKADDLSRAETPLLLIIGYSIKCPQSPDCILHPTCCRDKPTRYGQGYLKTLANLGTAHANCCPPPEGRRSHHRSHCRQVYIQASEMSRGSGFEDGEWLAKITRFAGLLQGEADGRHMTH